jgi:outer membrane lipoprotein carrier protein
MNCIFVDANPGKPLHMYGKTLIFSLLAAFFILKTVSVSAQKAAPDAKAKAILDAVSVKTKAYKTIKAGFTLCTETKEKKKECQDGTIVIKGNKYKLILKGQEFYNNGTFIWNYVVSAKEATKDFAPKPDEKNKQRKALDISKMFTMYEDGYKYKYEKEDVVDGVNVDVIDLYPAKPDEQTFHTVKLMIDKVKKQIQSVKFLNKDGSNQTITIKSLTPDTDVPDATFEYLQSMHPGSTLEDMTKD